MEAVEKIILTVLVVVILSVTGCVARSHQLIASSADPIATSCAMGMSSEACLTATSRR